MGCGASSSPPLLTDDPTKTPKSNGVGGDKQIPLGVMPSDVTTTTKPASSANTPTSASSPPTSLPSTTPITNGTSGQPASNGVKKDPVSPKAATTVAAKKPLTTTTTPSSPATKTTTLTTPNNKSPPPRHNTVSSTQTQEEDSKLKVGTARHNNSDSISKLDVIGDQFQGRNIDAEKHDILNKVLVCRNCEDINAPLAVWCADCHKNGDENPPVFCDTCNSDLHQFAKTKLHVRQSLSHSIHTTRMKTAQELGLTGSLLPPGLPVLESLACSNCDADPDKFCTQCKTILCTDCARDIHNPKLLRAHTRNPLSHKFLLAGFHAAAKKVDQAANGAAKSTAAATATNGAPKAGSLAALAGGEKKIGVIKHISVIPPTGATPGSSPQASPRGNGKTISIATPRMGTSIIKPADSPASKTFMPSSSPMTKVNSKVRKYKSTETSDIVPYENVGLSGDVFIFSDPSIADPLNEQQLEFRNVINPYDTIGAVQIISISCGMDHAGAVTALGSLFMWGSNVESQLGCGSKLGSERWTKEPILIEFPRHSPVKQVACGAVHTLALCQDSSVYAWGEGKMGKLGQVSDDDKDVPTLVALGHWGPRGEDETVDASGEEEVTYIACGQNNSGCVVRGRKDNYQLYIWGEGSNGQIPQPINTSTSAASTSTQHLLPKLFPQLVAIHIPENKTDPFPEVSSLSFGTKHVACTTKSGSVFTFGDNSFGQLGYILAANDGDNLALQLTPRLVPKLYLDGIKAKQVVCGERHTTILSSTGDVWSFGSGESHQIGILDNVDQFLPQKAVGLGPSSNNPIQSISVGAAISTAVNEAGETYMWGYGIESPTPVLIQGLKGKSAQKVCVGSNANLVFLTGSSAELYEWQFDGQPLDAEETHGTAAGEGGDDPNQQEEDGPRAGGKGTPAVNVSLRGKRLIAMSSGKNHYVVVTADGKMLAWGSNHLHECGLKLPGDISYIPHPLEIRIKVPIADVKCGIEHSIALSTNGQVYTWGTGFEGRLGHISNSDVPEPRLIQTLVDAGVQATSIAIGPSNTAIISKEGQVWIWGAGNGGQIGNEDMLPQFKPLLMKALTHEKVTAVALGNYHACCLTASGKVYTWGDNKFGQLGLYPSYEEDHAAYPQPVDSLNILNLNPTHIECGDNVCMVLTSGGEIYGWGTGETMQLCRRPAPMDGEEPEDDFGASMEDVPAPVKLVFPFQQPGNVTKITSFSVRDINCGCLTSDGDVYVWGWDLGEFPTKLTVKKPISGAAAAGSSSLLPGQSPPMEVVHWNKMTLGHTRMLLITQ